MARLAPRRAWSWARAACLLAVAGALFWPADDIPDLVRSAAIPSAPRTNRASDEPANRPLEMPADLVSENIGAAAAEEPLRDAPAARPALRGAAPQCWVQAPWQAFWSPAPKEAIEVPVARRAPAAYRLDADGRAAPVEPPAQEPGARTPAAKQALRAASAGEGAGAWRSPRALERLMKRLLGRIARRRAAKRDEAGRCAIIGPQAVRPSAGVSSRQAAGRSLAAGQSGAGLKEKTLKPPRWRPILLSRLLGKDAIRPPKTKALAPDMSPLAERVAKNGPDGKPLTWAPAPADQVEAAGPPSSDQLACRRTDGHWHAEAGGLYHERSAWGRWDGQGWLWLKKAAGYWWAWTEKSEPTWLRHGERWWWKSDDVWFLLHQGQAWGYRLFSERSQEGLIHPATGTQMLYSGDGKRVAVITPGDGAWLFDAETGAILGRWSEEQMPPKPKPRAPSAVTLPR